MPGLVVSVGLTARVVIAVMDVSVPNVLVTKDSSLVNGLRMVELPVQPLVWLERPFMCEMCC